MDILKKKMKEDKVPLSEDYETRIPKVEDVEVTNPNRNINEQLDNCNFNDRYNNKLLFPTMLNVNTKVNLNSYSKPYKFRQRIHPDDTRTNIYKLVIVFLIFAMGIAVTVYILSHSKASHARKHTQDDKRNEQPKLSSANFPTVSFTNEKYKNSHKFHEKEDIYPKGMTENMKNILKDKRRGEIDDNFISVLERKPKQMIYTPDGNTVLYNHIFWGPQVEQAMPRGFEDRSTEIWERYVNQSEIIKMELGCGRMQNRLATFKDGMQACVRYRQNTDQIQGEIFSFYLGKFLKLNNLAPSVVKVVDLKDKLWSNVATDIAVAQWNTNRAVVLTQYIPSLESAAIPDVFKPSERHLNKYDVLRILIQENSTILNPGSILDALKDVKDSLNIDSHIDMKVSNRTLNVLLELAQWADLIVFDYLTANLDRIVNNLFNFQWNANIMDGPAHNLAKKMDSGLLVFLDNESGLLHGYRLLKKYNVYHSLMLNNLCVFRKSTIDAVKSMFELENLGAKLDEMYLSKNNAVTRDVLPSLPEKNKKILHERLGNILNQVKKCEQMFSAR